VKTSDVLPTINGLYHAFVFALSNVQLPTLSTSHFCWLHYCYDFQKLNDVLRFASLEKIIAHLKPWPKTSFEKNGQ